jgi:GDP-mannose 6-dehydrogenase
MLENVLPSNQAQIERVSNHILGMEVEEVGIYGMAFKPGTDDLRESPYVKLASRLQDQGIEIRCYDPLVQVSELVGHNRRYMEKMLPNLPELLVDSAQSLSGCACIVLGHPLAEQNVKHWLECGKIVYDLAISQEKIDHPRYHSLG